MPMHRDCFIRMMRKGCRGLWRGGRLYVSPFPSPSPESTKTSDCWIDDLKGHYDLEMVRVKEIEERGENPWRIRVQNVVLDWQDLPGQR